MEIRKMPSREIGTLYTLDQIRICKAMGIPEFADVTEAHLGHWDSMGFTKIMHTESGRFVPLEAEFARITSDAKRD